MESAKGAATRRQTAKALIDTSGGVLETAPVLREFAVILFVYGTLRAGSKNEQAERLAKSARHIGVATISGRLYRVAHYPALAPPQSEKDRVKGDVFEGVTAEMLEWLDEYEGEEYSRQLAEVTMEDGRILTAYFYSYALPTSRLEWIPSGDWYNVMQNPLPREGVFINKIN